MNKSELAEKLIDGSKNIDNLSENELNEMIEYFQSYIDKMNQKIEKIKNHCIKMKNNI